MTRGRRRKFFITFSRFASHATKIHPLSDCGMQLLLHHSYLIDMREGGMGRSLSFSLFLLLLHLVWGGVEAHAKHSWSKGGRGGDGYKHYSTSLYSFGDNSAGQLGSSLAHAASSAQPVRLLSLSESSITSIAVGGGGYENFGNVDTHLTVLLSAPIGGPASNATAPQVRQ